MFRWRNEVATLLGSYFLLPTPSGSSSNKNKQLPVIEPFSEAATMMTVLLQLVLRLGPSFFIPANGAENGTSERRLQISRRLPPGLVGTGRGATRVEAG